jgi:starch synthase
LQNRTANGFSFGPFSIEDMGSTLFQAVETFRREPEIWQQLVETAMNRDSSWSHSGHKYVELYEQTIAKRKAMGRQLV